MSMYYRTVYFTLGEIIKYDFQEWKPCDMEFSIDLLLDKLTDDYNLRIDVPDDKMDIIKSLLSMIFDRFNSFIAYTKHLPRHINVEDVNVDYEICREVYVDITNVINLTQERYIALLDSFAANKSNPIGKISSTSHGKTKFNDTPQNAGNFENEEYTSNVTIANATTESDVGTIMSRLDELYRNWRNVLKDWTDEFAGLFIWDRGY